MEIWKDVLGYEGRYRVSSFGNVFSIISDKQLTPRIHTGGYLRVQLIGKDFYIHRLVADAFLARDPSKPEVNHIDLNKTNNNLSNLERCTRGENIAHGYKMGTRKNPGSGKFGGLNTFARKILAVKGDEQLTFGSRKELSKHLGVCHQSISDALINGHKCKGYTLTNFISA